LLVGIRSNVAAVTISPATAIVRQRVSLNQCPLDAARRRKLQERLNLETSMQTTAVRPTRDLSDATTDEKAAGAAERLLVAVRDLTPMLAARAEEMERDRRIPKDVIDAMRPSGLYRMLVPLSHGGLGLGVPDVVPVLEALAAADGSVGWVTMNAAVSQIFCTRLPRALYDEVYGKGPDPVVVGVGTPVGRAEKVAGGYIVSGRWPFASGCQNAQWIVAHCVVFEGGKPVTAGDVPLMRGFIIPAGRWRVEETWRAMGLAATGSHHVVLEPAEIPEHQGYDLLHGPSCVPGPFESAIMPLLSILHGAVAVGIAAGALADVTSLANGGKRQLLAASDLRDSTIFQHELGRAGAELRAARALLDVQAATVWRRAVAGVLDSKADFTETLQASAWIHAACTRVVDRCFTLAGAAAVLSASPLQRRLRDIHATGQHILVSERFYVRAGAQSLGFPPVDPISGR
jgi:alkylation response protein AidB-like acyl-CoA dehydrogenase